jgi:hypothetical protein
MMSQSLEKLDADRVLFFVQNPKRLVDKQREAQKAQDVELWRKYSKILRHLRRIATQGF